MKSRNCGSKARWNGTLPMPLAERTMTLTVNIGCDIETFRYAGLMKTCAGCGGWLLLSWGAGVGVGAALAPPPDGAGVGVGAGAGGGFGVGAGVGTIVDSGAGSSPCGCASSTGSSGIVGI